MKPVALALSPHLDDAAFSCGGTLGRLSGAGWRVVVATVFTASVPDPQGFALACQLDKGLGPEVDYMALRRAEDAAAAARLGAETRWLPFREAPHRGYESLGALFGRPLPGDAAVPALAAALRSLLDDTRPALVLAPQAVGGHVDHVQVVRGLDSVGPAVPVLWWRDFPYMLREAAPPEPFAQEMRALPERDVVLGGGEMEIKVAACLSYRSQLGFQFGGPAGLAERLAATGGVERFRQEGAMHGAEAALMDGHVPA